MSNKNNKNDIYFIYESIEKEIKQLDSEILKRTIKETEIELNKANKEYIDLFKNNIGDKEKIKQARDKIKQLMFKLKKAKNELDEREPEKIIERERNELREKAREVAKNVATGKIQIDSIMLRMLLVHSAGQVPYLEGDTGIGKSERVRQYAELLGMDYVKVMLTGKEKVHIEGNIIPEVIEYGKDANVDAKIDVINKYVEKGEATSTHTDTKALLVHKNTIPEYLNQVLNALAKGKHVLLHFDEFLRADKEVFNVVMDFILDNYIEAFQGRLKTGRLHKVASGNPTDAYYGIDLDPAQKQRFVFMKVKPDIQEFLKIVAPKKDIHPAILEFIQEFPEKDAFHTAERHREKNGLVGDIDSEVIGINPRKWTMISELLKVYEEDYAHDPDTKVLMLNILEETLLEDAETYGEKDLIKTFIEKYKSEDKLTLKRIKAALSIHYDDIYFVDENDKVSRPLENIFKVVDNLFKTYEVGKQLVLNKKIILLENAFNDFSNNFLKENKIEGKKEGQIKEILKEVIKESPEKVIPFIAILHSSGEAGIKMIQAKFKAMNLTSEGIELISAVDSLFNTKILTDYVGLSLDANGNQDFKKVIKGEGTKEKGDKAKDISIGDLLGIDEIDDEIDNLLGIDDSDLDEGENDKKKNEDNIIGD